MTTKRDTSVDSDEIRVRGVRYQGYGQIPKIVMLCTSISIEAKGIYAYFCSYTGAGNRAFPSRDHILDDLKMSKDTYYKHFKTLISLGLISVESVNSGTNGTSYKHNIYTIEEMPEGFLNLFSTEKNPASISSYNKVYNAGFLSAAGYGNIPKSIMLTDTSIQGKALYAYFCVFSSEDYMATPVAVDIIHHLHISRDSFNKYTNELLAKDYLCRTQDTNNGKFGKIRYYLNQMPGSDKPKPQAIKTSANSPVRKSSDKVFSDKVLSDKVLSDKVSSDTNITNTNITNTNITNFNQSIPANSDLKGQSLRSAKKIERAICYERNRQKIQAELVAENGIPYRYTEDLACMTVAVRLLTDWDERHQSNYYNGLDAEYQSRIYGVFVESLASMMTEGHQTTVKGAIISYAKVYEKVTDNFLKYDIDEDGEPVLSLGDLPDLVVGSYMRACRKRTVTNVQGYMESIIWSELQGNGLWVETLADHDIHTLEAD